MRGHGELLAQARPHRADRPRPGGPVPARQTTRCGRDSPDPAPPAAPGTARASPRAQASTNACATDSSPRMMRPCSRAKPDARPMAASAPSRSTRSSWSIASMRRDRQRLYGSRACRSASCVVVHAGQVVAAERVADPAGGGEPISCSSLVSSAFARDGVRELVQLLRARTQRPPATSADRRARGCASTGRAARRRS